MLFLNHFFNCKVELFSKVFDVDALSKKLMKKETRKSHTPYFSSTCAYHVLIKTKDVDKKSIIKWTYLIKSLSMKE